jgi:hypothetical protein
MCSVVRDDPIHYKTPRTARHYCWHTARSSPIVNFHPMPTMTFFLGAPTQYLCEQCVPKGYKYTQKLVNPRTPLNGMPAHPSPAAPSDQSRPPAANSLR